mmetsp:Transcript_33292/g.53992  ORF Transcript_33292/g.53992 Transcript_33292/m.53992 type:complete len:281 (-) Transcript_33292:613-1455(-)
MLIVGKCNSGMRWPISLLQQRLALRCRALATRRASCSSSKPPVTVYDVSGLIPYRTAWQWQKSLHEERTRACSASYASGSHVEEPLKEDAFILLEHLPVYTLGANARPEYLNFDPVRDNRYEVLRVERGGEVTYHGPGQIVGYPILDLRRYKKDLHWYVRSLEEVIIRVLARYGLLGERHKGLTGVWIGDKKVAAIGIKCSHWITMHGFAINVNPDLSDFDRIVPCGIPDREVTSIEKHVSGITCLEVRAAVKDEFGAVFGVPIVTVSARMNEKSKRTAV